MCAPGKDDIVTLTRCAKNIISDFHKAPPKNDTEEEKLRIIKAATAFKKYDIKQMQQQDDEYNFLESIENDTNALEVIPVSLQIFLNKIILAKCSINKIAPIGQAIIQASPPRTIIAPLQVFDEQNLSQFNNNDIYHNLIDIILFRSDSVYSCTTCILQDS